MNWKFTRRLLVPFSMAVFAAAALSTLPLNYPVIHSNIASLIGLPNPAPEVMPNFVTEYERKTQEHLDSIWPRYKDAHGLDDDR